MLSFISENTITNFPGNTSMLVDRVKSINIEKPFPGTDKNLIEAAVFLKQTLEGIQTFTLLGILSLGCFLSFIAIKKIAPAFRARQVVEKYNVAILLVCSVVAIVTTIGIVFSLIFEALRFFDKIPLFVFLFVSSRFLLGSFLFRRLLSRSFLFGRLLLGSFLRIFIDRIDRIHRKSSNWGGH